MGRESKRASWLGGPSVILCSLDGSYPTTNALCEIAREMEIMVIEIRLCSMVCCLFLDSFYHASGEVSKKVAKMGSAHAHALAPGQYRGAHGVGALLPRTEGHPPRW